MWLLESFLNVKGIYIYVLKCKKLNEIYCNKIYSYSVDECKKSFWVKKGKKERKVKRIMGFFYVRKVVVGIRGIWEGRCNFNYVLKDK